MLKEMPCEFFISGILENEPYEREWNIQDVETHINVKFSAHTFLEYSQD